MRPDLKSVDGQVREGGCLSPARAAGGVPPETRLSALLRPLPRTVFQVAGDTFGNFCKRGSWFGLQGVGGVAA